MKTVYTPLHHAHAPEKELFRGELVPVFERPERAERILQAVRHRRLGEVVALPEDADWQADADLLALIHTVHTPDYLDFLRTIFPQWQQLAPHQSYALPHMFNRLGPPAAADSPYARLGQYLYDAGTPITAGTWRAALGAAACAVQAQEILRGEGAAFALCRPPGHHAHAAMGGGYCFLNNVAIATAALQRHQPTARVAILDVDYHHGNGTQAIFYPRDDVFFVSIHGDPSADYPYFLGYSQETGSGRGVGYNANFPLPRDTPWSEYVQVLDLALARIRDYHPDYLLVSLGVDTYSEDSISRFLLTREDFVGMGRRMGAQGWPTLFVLEGGYYEAVGTNVVNVLSGFDAARP